MPDCSVCGRNKPPGEFTPRHDRPSGRFSSCRACRGAVSPVAAWPRVPRGWTPRRAKKRATAVLRRLRAYGVLEPPGECAGCRSVYAPLRALLASVEPDRLAEVTWLCDECAHLGPDAVDRLHAGTK